MVQCCSALRIPDAGLGMLIQWELFVDAELQVRPSISAGGLGSVLTSPRCLQLSSGGHAAIRQGRTEMLFSDQGCS